MNWEPPENTFEKKLLYGHLWLLLPVRYQQLKRFSMFLIMTNPVVTILDTLPICYPYIVANLVVAAMASSTTNNTSMLVAIVVYYSRSFLVLPLPLLLLLLLLLLLFSSLLLLLL